MGWIIVNNWDRFQHYGDRRQPPWIKLYLALLHDDGFQTLSSSDRSALVQLWMLYAMTGRRVRDDTSKLSRATGQRFTKATLERLNHAGFITISASKPLATKEVEVEKKRKEDDLLATLKTRVPKADATPEPASDPERLEKLRSMAEQIGLSL